MNGNPFGLGSVWKIISGWHMAHYRMPSARNQMLQKLRPTFCGPGIWTRTDFRALKASGFYSIGGGSTSAGLWDPAGARHICWLANRPHGLATYPSRSLREFGSLFSWLISCAQARSPPSTYCRARSSQYARFLATCSSNSLMPTPRPFGPNRYNQKLPEQHFLNFPQ
jgi:hypothetical protein